MPGRFPVFVRASSIRFIRAAHPPVVARFRLLHRDRKSFMHSLPSSRSAGIGPGSASVEAFLVWRVRGMFTRRVQFCVEKRKAQRRMEVQQGLRLDLRRIWRRLLSDNGRERMNTVAYLV